MAAADLAAALVAARARRAEEEGDGPVDLRDAGEKRMKLPNTGTARMRPGGAATPTCPEPA